MRKVAPHMGDDSVWALQIDPLGNHWSEYRSTELVRRRIFTQKLIQQKSAAVLGGKWTCSMYGWAVMEYWGIIVHSSSPPAPTIPWAWQRVPWTSATSYASIVNLKIGFSQCPLIDNSTSLAAKSAKVLQFLDMGTLWSYWIMHRGDNGGADMAGESYKLLILRSMHYWIGWDEDVGCSTSLSVPWKSTQSRPATPTG